MTPGQLATAAALTAAAILSLVEIKKLQINPWRWLGRQIGRAINGDVLDKLDALTEKHDKLQAEVGQLQAGLGQHVADGHRARILGFCNELIRDIPHSQEDYTEILGAIDQYEAYCRDHPDYPNNKAAHAIAHIQRCYDERLEKHDFV